LIVNFDFIFSNFWFFICPLSILIVAITDILLILCDILTCVQYKKDQILAIIPEPKKIKGSSEHFEVDPDIWSKVLEKV
jgi:hypothetical protein